LRDNRETMMASLHIKDEETYDVVTRLAERTGVSKTALVRDLAKAREAEMDLQEKRLNAREKLEKFWREHPLPPPTGLKADKAFYDSLWGED
jgi:antitoxin VapB